DRHPDHRARLRRGAPAPCRARIRAGDAAPLVATGARAAGGGMSQAPSRRSPIAAKVQRIPSSGIRKFFDLVASLEGGISLGIGEPDFVTPQHIRDAAIASIREGKTKYTSNYGIYELRVLIAR